MENNDLTEILSYLNSTHNKLMSELNNQNLNLFPADGGWSAGQVVAHLIKTEKYLYPLFSFVPKLIRSQKLLDKLDWLNTLLSKMAGMSFLSNGDQLPKEFSQVQLDTFKGRFTAPAFLKPRRQMYNLDDLLKQRAATRAKTLTTLRKADVSRLKQLRFSHPILGSFTLIEFVMFIGKHEEWHAEQLKRIKANNKV